MAQSPSTGSDDPVDRTNIDDVCAAWAQEKYCPKYNVLSVDTKHLKVIEENINYSVRDKKERSSVTHSRKTFPNKTSTTVDREIKDQSAKKYSCGWTRTKGHQVSGDLSVKVGLPAAVGLSAKIGGQVQLSNTKTEISGVDETSEQVTKFKQPAWSIWLTETVTTQKVITMPYTLDLRLEGTLSITLQKANGKTTKTKSVDVVDLCPEGKIAGKKSVRLTNEGIFEATTEMDQEVKVEEPVRGKLMRLIHNDLLKDYSQTIVEEVKDQRALCELLEVMSSENIVSEEQVKTVSQSPTVKEGVDNLVHVLENTQPENFLAFVNSLQRNGYDKLVKLLDPRPIYPNSLKTISNLSGFGVVDHYFVTKKVSEVKNILERTRRVIIHGICGSGKTQLMFKVAKDYERDCASVHPGGVVWVFDGTSEETFKDGVEKLRQSLTQGEADTGTTTLQSLVDQKSHALLLIDDLPTAKHIPKELLNCSAKMLITTQNSTLRLAESENILMEGFTKNEAVAFLTEEIPEGSPREDMLELAKSFSCLPLGLAAARGTIQECNMTLKEYMGQLQGGKDAVESLMDMEEEWLQDYYKEGYEAAGRNIFAALQMAVNKLDDQCKVMLQLCAFLKPQHIPILILKEEGEHPASVLRFVRDLKRFSLGNIEGEGFKRRLFIHGATQMAIRLHMDKQQQTTCINKLLQILVKFFLKDMTYSETHKFSLKLMPHVEAVLKHAEELDLGPEYPLMKARLLMVYGHLLIQKGTSDLSIKHLEEAKESLLQFAGILSAQSVERNPDYRKISKDLYQSLAGKSQSLEDSFFEETVIRRAIKKQILRAVSNKLGAEDSTTRKLKSMMENFEPLTMEMYNTLVDRDLAIPVEKLKRIFLPELYISIMFTLGKALFDFGNGFSGDRLINLALDMCTEVTNETGVPVMVRFLSDFVLLSLVKVIDMVISGVKDIEEPVLLKAVETLILYQTKKKDAETRSYNFGLLTGGGDTLLKLNYYENVMVCCIQAVQQAEEGEKDSLISWGKETCEEMLDLVEYINSRAGNPPLGLAEYYIIAGLFNVVVEELEKAAEMFWKAYRVELKREEYHPRMGKALMALIAVRIKQSKLGRARVCARRLLELAKEHWPKQVPSAEEELMIRKVFCRIVFQAIKENKKKGKLVCEKVTTV